MTYQILSPALVELAEAAEYYESKAPGLGADFIGEAERVISRIMDFPEAWSRIAENYRHCNFRRFPYAIVYSIEPADEILIVSIFHQHREPLSWKRNL